MQTNKSIPIKKLTRKTTHAYLRSNFTRTGLEEGERSTVGAAYGRRETTEGRGEGSNNNGWAETDGTGVFFTVGAEYGGRETTEGTGEGWMDG
eukprot:CAMPEP_0185778658 /NCGR_PEP_ID=MMETSP1174-20130828/93192_1 /TAXON_ID=35687 /ORGANISM="Dictyocha speculum, Strain CCMP1381" /LENGTH=92 /DNA_ID=CAMNT_0028467459 /DNA_START=1 /DNA_END=279 /DNA_ORIENTATION=-